MYSQTYIQEGHRGHNCMESVTITTINVRLNPVHGEVHSIQRYVIKFVSDFRQVNGFLRFPPPIKLTATI